MSDARSFVLYRLADCRKAFRSWNAVARALGTGQVTMSRWRSGKTLPREKYINRIDVLFYSLYPGGVIEGHTRRQLKRRRRLVKPLYDGFVDGDGI